MHARCSRQGVGCQSVYVLCVFYFVCCMSQSVDDGSPVNEPGKLNFVPQINGSSIRNCWPWISPQKRYTVSRAENITNPRQSQGTLTSGQSPLS